MSTFWETLRSDRKPVTDRGRKSVLRALASGFERLEDRVVLSAEGLVLSSVWFEQFSKSAAAQVDAGDLTLEGVTKKIDWLEQSIDVYDNEWIVQLDWDSVSGAESILDTVGLFESSTINFEVISGLGLGGQILLSVDDGTSTEMVDSWLGGNSAITYYEPNALLPLEVEQVPNDSSFTQLWGLNNTGQTGGTADADIDALEAWDVTTGSSDVVIAVIDTGVDYTHSDLAANIWTNPGEIAGNGLDDDGNGFVDDIHGYDFVNNDGDPMDDHSHGTHVSGTIAGSGNNGTGVAGVSWDSSIMGLKFLSGSGSGTTANAVRAVNYATMMRSVYGVNVVATNNSWGGGGFSQSLYDAISASGDADILFIAAAGNSASNNEVSPHYPSSYNLDNVISVAATDHNDNLANFSSYGATTVDLAAPGVSTYSTVPGGGYASYSGTSMATPHVSGVAALAWSINPDATAAEVKAAILGGVDSLSNLSGVVLTGGRLNALNTLDLMGMSVSGSSVADGSSVANVPLDYTIDFSEAYDASSVSAADFAVNGNAANSFTQVDANTITFHFSSTPANGEGLQVMAIAGDAITNSTGGGVNAWQADFYFDTLTLDVVSANVGDNEVLATPPTYVELNFNEAIDPASIQISDLQLTTGSVTGVTIVDADTLRFDVSLPAGDLDVTYTIAQGAIADSSGSSGSLISGSFTVDDPVFLRYENSGLNAVLPEYGSADFMMAITDSHAILDLDVELTISHTWNSDLDVFLISPTGKVIELFTDVGGSGDNFSSTILDDEASTSIIYASSPFSGRFRPEGMLADLDSDNTQGTWTLRVTDDYPADTGILHSWGLNIHANLAPTLDTISDQSMSPSSSLVVPFSTTDPNGDPLVISAVASEPTGAYDLDQEYGFYVLPNILTNNYYYNDYGQSEKYFVGTDGWFFILPDGEVHQWGGSVATSPLVGTLDARYHADPSLLYDAQQPGVVPVTVDVNQQAETLTITPAAGYTGTFSISLAASDGNVSTERSFNVTVTNAAPSVGVIADQTISPDTSLILPFSAGDADGDSLTITAVASEPTGAYDLDQEYGFYVLPNILTNNYYYNDYGQSEKYFVGTNGWFFILPNGEVHQWGGSVATSPLVGTLDASYHADPSLLYDAQQPGVVPVTIDINQQAETLTITPAAGYTGTFSISLAASDGSVSTERSFNVTVTNAAPSVGVIADQTMSPDTSLILPFSAGDADGDSLTITAVASEPTGAYDLDQEYGFYVLPNILTNNYYYNDNGQSEKYFVGTNDWFFILPNGEVHQWGGSVATSPLVGTLDASYHADPSLLYDAQQPGVVPVTIDVNQQAETLTITPATGYTGTFSISLAASDGSVSTERSFNVTVTNAAPTFDAISDQAMGPDTSLVVPFSANDADGDSLTITAVASEPTGAYDLDQEYGFYVLPNILTNNYYYNDYGQSEKYFVGTDGWFFILPNGEVHQWGGSVATSPLVGTLDASYHADPSLLYDAQQPGVVPVTIDINQQAETLTITPAAGYTGTFSISLAASDGSVSTQQAFNVEVSNQVSSFSTLDSYGGFNATFARDLETPSNSPPQALISQLYVQYFVRQHVSDASVAASADPFDNPAAVDAVMKDLDLLISHLSPDDSTPSSNCLSSINPLADRFESVNEQLFTLLAQEDELMLFIEDDLNALLELVAAAH